MANSPQYKPVGGQFKRQSGPTGRTPESPARFSPNGARPTGSPNARLGVPATYGPSPDSVNQLLNAYGPIPPTPKSTSYPLGSGPRSIVGSTSEQRRQGGIGGANGTAAADPSDISGFPEPGQTDL